MKFETPDRGVCGPTVGVGIWSRDEGSAIRLSLGDPVMSSIVPSMLVGGCPPGRDRGIDKEAVSRRTSVIWTRFSTWQVLV